MKTKLILAIAAIVIISSGKIFAQAWTINGNAGTNPATNFIGTTDYNGLRMKTNNKVRVTVKVNGDVGIGVDNPATKLDVNGTTHMNELLVGTATGATGYIASIGGKLIAEEVRVDLKAVWPDYVFSDKYSLMPLEEVQQFISLQKHLPGLPSADEIKSNGILLGEMQTKTMEKVEEQMLYILQLKNENNELKAQLQNMQQQINGLSKASFSEKK